MRKLFQSLTQKWRAFLRKPNRKVEGHRDYRHAYQGVSGRRRRYWDRVVKTHSHLPDPRRDEYLHSVARRRRAEAEA